VASCITSAVVIDKFSEAVKQWLSIMWPRACFRMELNCKAGSAQYVKAFDGLVVSIDVTDLNIVSVEILSLRGCRSARMGCKHSMLRVSNSKPMVLRCDPNTPSFQVDDRLIRSSVPISHLVGFQARCKAHELMTKTNTHDW
jgi:hypothetical protein